MDLSFVKYTEEWEQRWDRFVLERSVNGTFLQSRRFLNYHPPGRFEDASFLVLQGSSIAAVVPGCSTTENAKRCFFSHKGSTFGGLIVAREKYNISFLEAVFPAFEDYLHSNGYECAYIKGTSDIFSEKSQELLDYYFFKQGYRSIKELSFYVDCESLDEDICVNWSSGRRRDFKYSLKNGLEFRRLLTDDELAAFYELLKANLARHGASPVHSLAELKEFRDERFPDTVDFYGVFFEEKLIAGSMLFYFGKDVLHTQYLAQDSEYSRLYTMNFLNYNLIKLAKDKGFKRFSFGISTEERGKVLNTGLAVFKEGFGTRFCNNRSYYKEF